MVAMHLPQLSPSTWASLWTGIVGGIIAGVFVGVTLAVIGWALNTWRSRRIEKKIRRNLEPKGFGIGIYGFSVPVKNETDSPVIIRAVTLNIPPIGDLHLNYDEREKAYLARRNLPPPMASAGSLLHEAQLERHYVMLPAHAEGFWRVPDPDGTMKMFNLTADHVKVLGCRIEFEYETLFRSWKVAKAVGGTETIRILDSGLRHYLKVELPKTNAMRPKWGMAPGAAGTSLFAAAPASPADGQSPVSR